MIRTKLLIFRPQIADPEKNLKKICLFGPDNGKKMLTIYMAFERFECNENIQDFPSKYTHYSFVNNMAVKCNPILRLCHI